MSGRGLLILALLAALAVAGVVLTRAPAPPAGEAAPEPRFLPGLHERLESVRRVDVQAPDGADLATVVRGDGGWSVANRWDYPADLETLRGTLIGLAEARELEPKSDRPEGHARLGVAEPGSGPGSGLGLRLGGIEPAVAVLVGQPAAEEVGGTYLRRVGEDRAWLVSGAIERHDAIADWLDDRLVDLAAIRVHRVRIEPVDGEPVEVLLPSQDAPRFEILGIPEGRQPLSRTLSKSIARGLAELTLVDVRPAAETRLPPLLARTRFETFDGLVIEVEAFAAGRGEPPRRLVRLRASTLAHAGPGLRESAAGLNARFDGWLYRIPDYKFVNLTYRFADVLAPE
ncbi:MAG: DUF4340 domain-containing protein [Halofilum sp. (in: g-proteobacteria)]|nr:DUF4340 domain-containing protein [Halofilum sp. (in: g-proteobacteria)]